MLQSNEKSTLNYQYYLKDCSYKDKSNFNDYWNQMQGFFEGTNHYPLNVSKALPKSITNICKFLILNRASKIIGTPYTIVFQTAGNDDSTLQLQHFYKFILLTMQDDIFNYEAVENGEIYGQEVTYITYDKDYTTFKAFKQGGFREVHIDLRHFAVSNPHEPDIQKQQWLMYWSDESVQTVREMCLKMKGESEKDFKDRISKVLPDNYQPDNSNKTDREDVSYGICTIYTRFFRVDGEVYFQTSTKDVDLFSPKPLSPHAPSIDDWEFDEDKANENGDKITDYENIDPAMVDAQEAEPKDMSDGEYIKQIGKFSMYPFCVYRPTRRMNHFYGISELQDVIGNQQIINALPSYMAYDIKKNASGKVVAKNNALQGQKITDEAGQVITDYSNSNGFGIKRLEGQTLAVNVMDYVNQIFGLTRTVTGTTELFTGEMSKDLSGTAISLLQEQGNTTIEQQQKNFNNGYCVDKAKIIFQFIMHYVDEQDYLYERGDADYEEQTMYRKKLMEMDQSQDPQGYNNLIQNQEAFNKKYPPVNHIEQESFSSKPLRNKVFFVQPKSGRGIKYSEIIQADFLEKLLLNGGIEKYDSDHLSLILDIIPLVDETTKANLKVQVEKMKNSEVQQLNQSLKQAQQQLAQAAQVNEKYQQVLEYLKTYNTELSKQFSQQLAANKLQIQNRDTIISNLNKGSQASQPQDKTQSKQATTSTISNNIAKEM